MSRTDNHITWQEFKEIAGQHKIVDQLNLQNLADGLHNCGSIVWFNQRGLRDLIVLKPQWLADLVVNFTAKIQSLVDGTGFFFSREINILQRNRGQADSHEEVVGQLSP